MPVAWVPLDEAVDLVSAGTCTTPPPWPASSPPGLRASRAGGPASRRRALARALTRADHR